MKYDLFISHASEDKATFVRPLAQRLRQERYRIWYDEFELKVGDSLTGKIDYGLSNSKAGLIVLSPSFMKKKWPQRELAGLVTRQLHQGAILIPVWHAVTISEVIAFSPPLADIKALNSSGATDDIVSELRKAVSPSDRDFSDTTIEEAEELLERGSFESSFWIAFRAFDERLFSICRARMAGIAHQPSSDLFDDPATALESLLKRGELQKSDKDGGIDYELLRSSFRHRVFSFALPEPVAKTEATSFVIEVGRFLRANPLMPEVYEESAG